MAILDSDDFNDRASDDHTEVLSNTPEHSDFPYLSRIFEITLLVLIFISCAGDSAPMVNESHYLIKAKSYWVPEWCERDPFVASGKAHLSFYFTLGWLTQIVSFESAAWIGRIVGWLIVATGLSHLSWNLFRTSFLSIPLAVLWMAGIEWGNLAGEWVFGGIEGKVPAFGFVLAALGDMVRRRWSRTWILLGCASAFHVLTGGWSLIAAVIAWWFTERRLENAKRLLGWPIALGGLIALFGLLPALQLQAGATAEESAKAARIYAYYRLPHHLVPSSFHLSWYLRHALLLTLVTFIGRRFYPPASFRSLSVYTISAFSFSCVGLIIGLMISWNPDLAAKLLRYYWFRLADAMIPLFFACLVINLYRNGNRRVVGFAYALTLLCGIGIATQAILRNHSRIPPAASSRILGFDRDASSIEQQEAYKDWVAVCNWSRRSSHVEEIFLTPRHQQTFKWYAQRSEVANWKDVPQDASSLIQWHERFQELYPQRLGYRRITIQYPDLRKYREKYGVRWMIVDRRITGERLPLIQVYPVGKERNSTYAVYELPSP